MNDTFYKPGGPVFLQIGGEGTANPIWMVTGAWVTYGQQYHAMLIQVEHRYYGKSHPVRYAYASSQKVKFLGYICAISLGISCGCYRFVAIKTKGFILYV